MNIIIQDKDITLFLNLLSEEFDIHINGIYWNKDFEFSWRNLFGTCKTFFGNLQANLMKKKTYVWEIWYMSALMLLKYFKLVKQTNLQL